MSKQRPQLIDEIYDFIKENPGAKSKELAQRFPNQLPRNSAILRLRMNGKITTLHPDGWVTMDRANES